MQDGVGRAAGGGNRRDGVLEGLAGEYVGRYRAPLQKVHYLLVRHPARRMRTYGLKNVLDSDVLALVAARRYGASIDDEARNAQADERHRGGWDGLVET